MSESEAVIRIAAKGDGVTASGRHVLGGVTGDVVESDGTLSFGPHHVEPPCRHFPECGGCQLQYADESVLRQFVTDRVVNAAEGQGLAIGTLLETHLSPPKSRRRATLHGMKTRSGAVLGFKQQRSHHVLDLRECPVLDPALFRLIAPLRDAIARYAGKRPVDISLTLADQGVDCTISGIELDGLAATEGILELARTNSLTRLTVHDGYTPQTVWEPEPVTVSLGRTPVGLPVGSFLQPTQDGEQRLCADVREFVGSATTVADFFAGLGTFAFSVVGPAKVLAVEAARDAHLACKLAADRGQLPVHTMHRDLFRNPLQPQEIGRFDAAILDPPRAGAHKQVTQIAQSDIERVAYVSCNPASWARDAKTLIDAGFRLEKVRPVGQFRWSTHVELTSLFMR
ncbi:class I SAM-dependent RNA methyltransferase [Erythrobacter litoralis]|uniref:class I SAM-dependent RNA methyltransferase n=1 Tax=Erythrobacter litoralis TaxID=39960 RepID=UPI002434951A|nr:class I SAM-dependent RNA methyltransferase [Erythrobacter litoralis]MDG6078281.1 class I SAM-dependent RNA methyltransferase [Erythrobacter litoralis]